VLRAVVSEHGRIVDALERRDAPGALAALVEHLHKSDYALRPGRGRARQLEAAR
jgi:DNA-binding GntR family transcriptional regulator